MKHEQSLADILAEINSKGKALCYTKGRSMQPMLKEGRDISVLVSAVENLRVGDVVMYVRPNNGNELVLHRIVKILSEDLFSIRGDNTYYDEEVRRENIKALLEGFFRKGKYVDCKKSKSYRIYSFFQVHFYFLRRFFCKTLRATGAKIKNNIFHLNGVHLDSILRRK